MAVDHQKGLELSDYIARMILEDPGYLDYAMAGIVKGPRLAITKAQVSQNSAEQALMAALSLVDSKDQSDPVKGVMNALILRHYRDRNNLSPVEKAFLEKHKVKAKVPDEDFAKDAVEDG